MCGRFVQKSPANQLASFFDIKGPVPNFAPRYNLAPTQDAAVVVAGGDGRRLEIKKWGLIPAWSKEGKAEFATFNARAESVREKPTYRQAFQKRRCIVPADGFYEWTGPKGDKIPHLFERQDGTPLALAGLHETWRAKDGAETIHSFTIVVTAANQWMSRFHDRMPVILDPADFDAWLTGNAEPAATLLHSAPEETLKERVVPKLVNSVKNEGAELLAGVN
ncbi:SOS response-associated peptidase [Dongia sp.]|uniref:SOS response-associated peptidase n=1 Tax=Dongia sp. TaxID=1977262 RepID=UPI0035AFFBCD